MKIDAIAANQAYPVGTPHGLRTASVGKSPHATGISTLHLSFKGNPDKIPGQIAAAATESNFLGGIYKAGGLGDVGEALPDFIGLKAEEIIGKKIDMRSFYPYYSMDDGAGRIYVLTKEGAERRKNLKPKEYLDLKRDFKLVEQNYKLQEGEQFALITEIGNQGNSKIVKTHWLLKDTGLSGSVDRMAEKSLEMEKVPYRLFEVDTAGKRQDRIYLIHTPEHAKGKSAYGVYRNHAREAINGTLTYGGASNAYGGANVVRGGASTAYGGASTAYGGSSSAYGASRSVLGTAGEKRMFGLPKTDDMFYTEFMRAYEQLTIEGLMNNEANGNFNPQNHMFHDRFCYPALTDITQKAKSGNKSYLGLRFSEILHNPGAAYQGKYYNPLDFFRIVATPGDLAKLKANEHYSKVKAIADKIETGKATEEECTQLFRFFKPYLSKFMDSEGNFNMTMIAVRMTDENPDNSSLGNVSKNYGKETRNMDTTDIAKGLTEELIKIEKKTIDVVNGSRQANMGTDKMDGFFGTGSLNELMKKQYKPFKATDNPEKIYNAKIENKKTIINAIADATDKLSTDSDAIAKVLFSDSKMRDIRNQAAKIEPNLKLSLGGLSKYEKGDILFTSWGRPDAQKGFPMTLEAFEAMLKDDSIPLETRKHCKLLMGAGGGNDAFSGNNAEWKAIQESMERIANIEVNGKKGIFKGNACYINGLFPSRLVNGADAGIFTSRFEPCGITPFECFATGTPVISTNTGGAPDFVKPGKTGFLTKDPFMLNAEKVGLAAGTEGEALDKARRSNIAKQIAEQIKAFVTPLQNNTWDAKQKEYIKNCVAEKIEWHNNNAYNGGKSALEIYLKQKFNVMNNDIPNEYVSDMRGEFDNSAFTSKGKAKIIDNIKNFFRSKAGKWTAGIAGTAAIIGLGYTGYKKGVFSTKYDDKKEDNLSLSKIA